jgi:hypothetical protein
MGNAELHENKQDSMGQKRAKELTVDRLPLTVDRSREEGRDP